MSMPLRIFTWSSRSVRAWTGRAFAHRCSSTTTISKAAARSAPFTIGILRETYDRWERRAPLCPHHVRQLLDKYNNNTINDDNPSSRQPGDINKTLQFLVQPATHRIFSNQEYQAAGAFMTEDLASAHCILGVKRPHPSQDILLPNKTYLFFSHVIKGQPEGMSLLQDVLDKKIQLIDYECIVEEQTSNHRPKRLAAFGKFAGMAGMMDTLQALGRRLLLRGYSTPFLQCPPAYMHSTVEDAKETIRRAVGQVLKEQGTRQPEPLVFAITGKGGKVYSGVMEILDLIPHQVISVDDLPRVHQLDQQENHFQVFVVPLTPSDLYQRSDHHHNQLENSASPFDRADFEQNPCEYESTFHERVAPYVHVLVNCMYWDDRYPRILTKEQTRHLYEKGNRRITIVSDISCDLKGAIEFLERTTTIERPYFQYDPILQKEVADEISEAGITVMGVDILPTELARESTEHFGDAVSGVLEETIDSFKGKPFSSKQAIDLSLLPPKLRKACITSNGSLTPNFLYLKEKARGSKQPPPNASMDLILDGHLFDSGLINQVLDILEIQGCKWEFLQCGANTNPKDRRSAKSKAMLRITGVDSTVLGNVQTKIETLITVMEKAEATVFRHNWNDTSADAKKVASVGAQATVESSVPQNVLLLGAGMVSQSVVTYLGRRKNRSIVVASDKESKAREVAAAAANGRPVGIDITNDPSSLSLLIQQADVVVSLLPAPLHPKVAEFCIEHRKHLVTASYESDAMRQLHERASAAGILILNEVGLDPGLDHMSALRIINGIRERGGSISSFKSVCGGLPSPECEPTPLMYKFSWSPRGVLRACQNDAKYREDGSLVEVYGKELLSAASPFLEAWPALQLECLPNRNSLIYEQKYGIENAKTIFRGTLRYRGFSSLMNVFQNMGLLEELESQGDTWEDVFELLRKRRGGFRNLDDFVLACAEDDAVVASKAMNTFKWLGMTRDGEPPSGKLVVDAFCHALEKNLQFGEQERDMVVMHHSIEGEFEDGTIERHQSSLQAFGEPGMSAMSKTVGYTTAAATELVLSGSLRDKCGLMLPTSDALYEPILEAVDLEGIRFVENMTVVASARKSEARAG